MVETVFSAALPIGENLVVRKNRMPGTRRRTPRVAVVTGMHGDELAGQFVAYELTHRLAESARDLSGMVDIYPALNPLGISARSHGVPQFDIDLDRTFPGNKSGNLTEALAAAILDDIAGASACIIVRSSDAFIQEVPQARIEEENNGALLKIATLLNARLVWTRKPAPAAESTLAHALNQRGTPTVIIKMGSDIHDAENAGAWIVEGILRLLFELHAWSGPTMALPSPKVSRGDNVATLLSEEPGLFLPRSKCGSQICQGQTIGLVVNPLEGTVKQEIKASGSGLLLALRTYPVVYPGSLVARVLED